ncbi:MAG: hypothetical protein JJU06_08740 [Ectothiorhodospiraceae bacterium]|nr:hypothetical protein [Ectothiorhodospiraceae bacterium]
MDQGFVRALVVALLLCFASPLLAADKISWNNLSLAWIATGDLEIGSSSRDLKGYRLAGTASLTDFIFVGAIVNSYHVADGSDFDMSTQQIGVGARYSLPNLPLPLDVWTSLNYERLSEGGELATGPGVDLGVRALVYPALELALAVKPWSDLNFDSYDVEYTGYELSAAYSVIPSAALTLALGNHTSDEGTYKIRYRNVVALGVRYQY